MLNKIIHLAKVGDYVRIIPSRPYSAIKRHILKDVIRKAKIIGIADKR